MQTIGVQTCVPLLVLVCRAMQFRLSLHAWPCFNGHLGNALADTCIHHSGTWYTCDDHEKGDMYNADLA